MKIQPHQTNSRNTAKQTTNRRCETSCRVTKSSRKRGQKDRKPKGNGNKGCVHNGGEWMLVSVMYVRIVYRRLGTSLWAIARGQTSGTRVHPLVRAGYSATPTRPPASTRVSTPNSENTSDETVRWTTGTGVRLIRRCVMQMLLTKEPGHRDRIVRALLSLPSWIDE